MDLLLSPGPLRGTTAAIPSKSAYHRLVLCAALAQGCSRITPAFDSQDIRATLGAVQSLGAKVAQLPGTGVAIQGVGTSPSQGSVRIHCAESGSTLRFLIPVAAALGIPAVFTGEGRLPRRPLDPYVPVLREHGVAVDYTGELPFSIRGRLTPGEYRIAADISSQFITGLLFALPLLDEDSTIVFTSQVQSKPYIDMTVLALAQFGVTVTPTQEGFFIGGSQRYRAQSSICEGDWSNAAFFLCAGAIGGSVTCTGLRHDSPQGDKRVLEVLRDFGAQVLHTKDGVTVSPPAGGALRAVTIDAGDIPDLVPVLCAVASCARGTTHIHNAARLRLKESDRIASMQQMLESLGVPVTVTQDSMHITGAPIRGGEVSSCNDHRIAMTAAVMALRAQGDILLTGAECVRKSFPAFFREYQQLGGKYHVVNVGE